MPRTVGFLILGLALAFCAMAQTSQTQPNPAITSGPATRPLDAPAETDMVTWTRAANALYPFGRAGSAVLGNYLYCFGSEGANVAQAFNLTTERWQPSTPALVGYDNWPAVATADAIYLIGRSALAEVGNEVQRFIPTSGGPRGTWTLMAPYPQTAYGVNAAWDGGNFIYASGGTTGSSSLNTAYKYDLANDSWQPISNLPVAMVFAGAAFIGGRYHVLGGNDTGTAHYAYDPATDAWTARAAVPTAIYFATASVTHNDAYLFSVGGGGGYYVWPATNAVQVYNPVTDAWWQDTPLPAARGCNSACWVGDGEVISAGGFYNGWSSVTYRGSGFPGGPAHDIDITLTPVNPPINIPATGGSFDYNIALHNNETGSIAFDVWILIQLPSGTWTGPVLGPLTVTLSGGGTLSRVRTQSIPGSAPPGMYVCRGYVGNYATSIWDSSSFTFEKQAAGRWSPASGDGSNAGEVLNQIDTNSDPDPSSFGLANYPNPFNPTTAISFELRAASFVNLRIYDIAGRLVTELVNGWRDVGVHEAVFDGSQLPSGVYVYRLQAGDLAASGKMVLLK